MKNLNSNPASRVNSIMSSLSNLSSSHHFKQETNKLKSKYNKKDSSENPYKFDSSILPK